MKGSTEERLFSVGCLVVLFGICVSGYLAFSSNWKHWGTVTRLLGGWFFICWIRSKRDHRRYLEALDTAFAEAGLSIPELTEIRIYGIPAFTLTFESEAALNQAETSNGIAAFTQAIQDLYGHLGTKRNPFDAKRAIYATYAGKE